MRNLLIIVFVSNLIFGQAQDSIKTYNLEEITVQSGIIVEPKTTTELPTSVIERTPGASVYDIAKFVPSLKFQTNSRGEGLIYIRGSEKRQMTVFLDGIPLNIPWDNRVDLSMIPNLAIGSLSAIKGIPSSTFGANTPAGVVTIYTKEPQKNYLAGEFSSGSENFDHYELSGGYVNGKVSFIGAADYSSKDDFRLPSELKIGGNKYRKNTDYEKFNLFAKTRYQFDQKSNVNLSLSYTDARKGIAPELDVASPRYWRYPTWKKIGVSLFGTHSLMGSRNNLISYAFGYTKFDQQINDYSNDSYSTIDDIEKDFNNTIYGRLLYTTFIGTHSIIKLSGSGYTFTHDEKYLTNNYKVERYKQNLFSLGGEYEFITNASTLIVGASYDINSTPETGGKPHADTEGDYGFNASYLYKITPEFAVRLNGGRKKRFAALREAYSGALGRFVLNPDLKPEVVSSIDAGLISNGKNYDAEINFFFSNTEDGIVRKALPGKKFMRVNKDAIRTYGVELISEIRLSDKNKISFNLTWMDSKGKSSGGAYSDTLEYKPMFISSMILDYYPLNKFNMFAEFKFVSEEFGLKEGSEYYQKLPQYVVTNVRFSYKPEIFNDVNTEFYFRINNLFDILYYPQWGLPEAGREIIGGIKFNY